MKSWFGVILLLLIGLIVLAACMTPASIASAPASVPVATSTVTPMMRQQAVEAVSTGQTELASGRYQLLMFYSPL